MVGPDALRRDGGEADLVHDRARAPGLADAEAVHVAHAHVGDHLRRRHGDGLGVAHRIDAMRRQPVIQPHGVGACGKGLGEGVFALVAGHQPGQRLAVARASLQQLVGQGDRLAILVQPHKHRHVLARTADAQVHAVDQPIQHMSEIQLAVHELVPHAGPGSLLGQRDGDAVLLVQAQRRGHHHGRAIRQRDEADLHLGLFRRIGAGRPGAGAHQRIYQGQQARARRRARGPREPAAASGIGAIARVGFRGVFRTVMV